jgi:hypothetical protein
MSHLHILTRAEEESWLSFSRRIRETQGDIVVVLTSTDNAFLRQSEERRLFLSECASIRERIRIATKEPGVIEAAESLGLTVYHRTRQLRQAVSGHPKAIEALRLFSPSLWRQQWRSRLQRIGLLSLPRLRIWFLICLSIALFLFVIFRLLPSAEVRVWPRTDLMTQTMNVMLVASGSVADVPRHARTMPLVPISVRVTKSLTYTDISNQFSGNDAEVTMTVYNTMPEPVDLKKGSRLLNQAGMVFRLQKSITVPSGGSVSVLARADHEDIYGKIMGDRGNVPAGLQWTFAGLEEDQKKLVFAQNKMAAKGGRTAYQTLVQQKDIDAAQKRLENELLVEAKERIKKQQQMLNSLKKGVQIELLEKSDLIQKTYTGFIIPVDSLHKSVDSITLQGSLDYAVPAYDAAEILRSFGSEIESHTGEGKELMKESLQIDPDKAVVIEYSDTFNWIKMTIDILATERSILDPLTPTGAEFGKKVRDDIAGLSVSDALRIVRNMPEVDKVEISMWPPWSRHIPDIPSHISIVAP